MGYNYQGYRISTEQELEEKNFMSITVIDEQDLVFGGMTVRVTFTGDRSVVILDIDFNKYATEEYNIKLFKVAIAYLVSAKNVYHFTYINTLNKGGKQSVKDCIRFCVAAGLKPRPLNDVVAIRRHSRVFIIKRLIKKAPSLYPSTVMAKKMQAVFHELGI